MGYPGGDGRELLSLFFRAEPRRPRTVRRYGFVHASEGA